MTLWNCWIVVSLFLIPMIGGISYKRRQWLIWGYGDTRNLTQAGPKCHTRAKMSHSHVIIDRNPTPTIDLNSPVFTETRTLNLQRTPSLRLLSTMLSAQLGSNLKSGFRTGACHYGSSAWGLSPSLKMRPRDGVGGQNRRPFIFQCVFYILGRRHIEPWWQYNEYT